MTSEQTFPLFPNLPTELRLSILSFAVNNPPPRTVSITQISGPWALTSAIPIFDPSGSRTRFIYTDGTEQYRVHSSPSGVPALLHVNSLARDLALRRYSLIVLDPVEGRAIYFDLEKDMLVLKCHPAWGNAPDSPSQSGPGTALMNQLRRVQNLTILGFRHRGYTFATLSLTPFLGLRELIIVRGRNVRIGGRSEKVVKRVVVGFWWEYMHARQMQDGVDFTEPPDVEFLEVDETATEEVGGIGG